MLQNRRREYTWVEFSSKIGCGESEAARDGSPIFDGRSCSIEVVCLEHGRLEADGQSR